MGFERDVVIVGGCGHVGLPLGLAFADRGLNVALFDLNADAVDQVESGVMPFAEAGAARGPPARGGEPLDRDDGSECGVLGRERGHRDRHPG